MSRARTWLWLGAWVLTTALVLFLASRVDARLLGRVLREADPRWLLAAIGANLLILPFGSLQWRAFLPSTSPVPRRRLFELFALTSVANNTTPSLLGHITGVLLLGAEPGVGRAAALSVLALDQIAVGVLKLGVLVAASLLLPLPAWMRDGLRVLAFAVAVLLTLVLVAALQHRRVSGWSARGANASWVRRLLELLERWTRDLESLRRPRRFALGLGWAVATKCAEALAIFAVQRAFGLALPPAAIVLVLAATSLATFVPFAPANIGTYEASTYAAYRALGLPTEAALGVALAQHLCQLLPAIGVGYTLLSVKRLRSPSVSAASTSATGKVPAEAHHRP